MGPEGHPLFYHHSRYKNKGNGIAEKGLLKGRKPLPERRTKTDMAENPMAAKIMQIIPFARPERDPLNLSFILDMKCSFKNLNQSLMRFLRKILIF